MSLRIALLGLLSSSGSASGYDLAKSFERSINHAWQASHSQIYPELVRMAADKLVTVEAEGTRGRKTYTITSDGRAELRRWIVDHRASGPARSEYALQAFLISSLDPADAIDVVRRMRAASEARLRELERTCELKESAGAAERDYFGKYALDLGLRQTRMAIQWARDTIEDLERRSPA
jgi:DNA-binding PadR family transcriptional regulator